MAQTLYRYRALSEGLGVPVGTIVTFGAGDLLGGLDPNDWGFVPEATEIVLSPSEQRGEVPAQTTVYNPATNTLIQQPIAAPIPHPVFPNGGTITTTTPADSPLAGLVASFGLAWALRKLFNV